jgi:hypothetical protein
MKVSRSGSTETSEAFTEYWRIFTTRSGFSTIIPPALPTGAFNKTASQDVQPVLFLLIKTAPLRIFADIDLFNK